MDIFWLVVCIFFLKSSPEEIFHYGLLVQPGASIWLFVYPAAKLSGIEEIVSRDSQKILKFICRLSIVLVVITYLILLFLWSGRELTMNAVYFIGVHWVMELIVSEVIVYIMKKEIKFLKEKGNPLDGSPG